MYPYSCLDKVTKDYLEIHVTASLFIRLPEFFCNNCIFVFVPWLIDGKDDLESHATSPIFHWTPNDISVMQLHKDGVYDSVTRWILIFWATIDHQIFLDILTLELEGDIPEGWYPMRCCSSKPDCWWPDSALHRVPFYPSTLVVPVYLIPLILVRLMKILLEVLMKSWRTATCSAVQQPTPVEALNRRHRSRPYFALGYACTFLKAHADHCSAF